MEVLEELNRSETLSISSKCSAEPHFIDFIWKHFDCFCQTGSINVSCVFGVRGRTITSVAQVGPDDVFLWETEDTEPASSHRGVDHYTRVRHHVCPLKQLHSETQKHKGPTGLQTKRSLRETVGHTGLQTKRSLREKVGPTGLQTKRSLRETVGHTGLQTKRSLRETVGPTGFVVELGWGPLWLVVVTAGGFNNPDRRAQLEMICRYTGRCFDEHLLFHKISRISAVSWTGSLRVRRCWCWRVSVFYFLERPFCRCSEKWSCWILQIKGLIFGVFLWRNRRPSCSLHAWHRLLFHYKDFGLCLCCFFLSCCWGPRLYFVFPLNDFSRGPTCEEVCR